MRAALAEPFTGDLDEMVKRRLIRVGVTFNRTFYFVDKGVQRGVAYEFGKAFEDAAEQEAQDGQRDEGPRLLRAAAARPPGAGAARGPGRSASLAQVTVRPELQAVVDFTTPTRTNVSEVVVTGPGAPAIASVDDLSGKDVCARKDSTPARAWSR